MDELYAAVRGEGARRNGKAIRVSAETDLSRSLLATGFADLCVDPVLMPWDLSALIPVVRGAGGVITAWDGSEAVGATSAVAASPALHATAIEILNG